MSVIGGGNLLFGGTGRGWSTDAMTSETHGRFLRADAWGEL
jgi:hypothetical protein